ncbi:MAG: NADPH-dependent glutamate synthase [Ignavibacteriaceae bacterium]|jgi:glutamate synthase (NADPH/NADH) small chain|nr:NADPH-dependent glutamate synthase [Ignavibacteriaceae bacterium]MCW8813031.1 NADPH-dependent glutamate synthase [Chlorobium sp.]MCW8818666.1 NADPH-dependent glutamate synthase [Ignavibacteriaceae bacterium]MCW8822834.1 NADPH-dependent glutamate synthase [Ignavibacteriaceae bacterium]MCW8961768.1 NADPH-dependent glutamate synthase [Ignavibacteriaceae bacterium]
MSGKISNKERMKIPRQLMPEQDSSIRRTNFNEVNLGFTEELAKMEAMRCIQCPKPSCVEGCPVGVKIGDFIALVADGNYLGAAAKLKEDNLLPAICGRVCPQEEQCEVKCVTGKKGEPVAIGRLERFVADYERETVGIRQPELKPKTGKKVAIVGSGPAGLSCAGDLIQMGHDVTVFEALHDLGGVLIYGIPEFRLPKSIVKAEIDSLKALGVEFKTNSVIGFTDTVDELLANGYDSVFIAVGAGLPYFLNIPGENLNGVYSSNEFLTRVNLMKAYRFPEYDTPVFNCKDKNVAVFGGGNTAMDAVRTSKRLGAKNSYIIYRRSDVEMPAREEEIHHAKEEGIEFIFLSNPVKFTGDKDGWLRSVTLQRMELGEPDASGRRRPIPVSGSEYDIPIDMAVIAIGNGSNPIIQKTTPDMNYNKWGNIVADETTMRTSKVGVFAGGDIVTGGATVILAMGAGRKAASAINRYLLGEDLWLQS